MKRFEEVGREVKANKFKNASRSFFRSKIHASILPRSCACISDFPSASSIFDQSHSIHRTNEESSTVPALYPFHNSLFSFRISPLSLSFTASQPLCKVQRPTPHLILLQATIVRRRGLRSCEKKKRLVNLLSNLNRSHGGQVVDRNARQRSGLPRGQPRDAKKLIFRFSRSNPHASPSSPRTSASPYNFILRSSQASAPLRCSPLLQEVHLLFFQD